MKRRELLHSMLLGSSVAALPAAAAEQNRQTAGSDTLSTEIEALLRQTEQAWDSQDTSRIKALWDTDDESPYYLAGEQEDWFVGGRLVRWVGSAGSLSRSAAGNAAGDPGDTGALL